MINRNETMFKAPFNNQPWRELTRQQRGMIVAAGAAQFACIGTALWDLSRRPAHLVRGSKKLWTPVVFINFVGPMAYFLFGRKRRTGSR